MQKYENKNAPSVRILIRIVGFTLFAVAPPKINDY